MMKSVALTESYFVLCDDNDYVVVDTPFVSQNHAVVDVMTSIYDEVNDDGTTGSGSSIDDEGVYGKDTDDASYDYCDEFLTVEKIQNPSTTKYASNDDTANPTAPFEVDLSLLLLADDDVESLCPPSITEDDTAVDIVIDTDRYATAAVDPDDDDVDKEEINEPVRNKNNNNNSMSNLSITKQEKITTSQTGCSDSGDVPNDDEVVEKIIKETKVTSPNVESIFPESETTDLLPITTEENQGDDANHPPPTINNNEMIVTRTDAEADVVDFPSSNITKPVQATASETKTTTQDNGEWIESTGSSRYRRMSNKKRRKQMKLAKRTSAAMANLSLSSSKSPSTSTKGLIIRRCGGKQVTPIIVEMSNTVIGM